MYKVGILVNENEMAHSSFANTPQLLSNLGYIKKQKDKYYRFFVFDKFNINDLFRKSDTNYIMTFDSLFVATNATNNTEIYEALLANKDLLTEFLSSGKGIFIASQKKLSTKDHSATKTIGFLPNKYDYAIVDRPEKSSATGKVSIVSSNNQVVNFPTPITESDIEYHCLNNNFMQHKYRSFIVATNDSYYQSVLADTTSTRTPHILESAIDKSRKVLLVSRNEKERLVICTMALDWAGHAQLVENILIYITEGPPNFAFMIKSEDNNEGIINSYILRAKVGKIAFGEYTDLSINEMVHLPHNIFIFSTSYTELEVNSFIDASQNSKKSISVYRLVASKTKRKALELYHYTNQTSVDQIRSETTNWILGNFYPNLWGKSVWTYSYVLTMMKRLGIDAAPLLPFIYEELASHFCKKGKIDGSYDNVINATSKLLEILHLIESDALSADADIFCAYPVQSLKKSVGQWLINKLRKTKLSEFDLTYVLVALYKTDIFLSADQSTKKTIIDKTSEIIQIHSNKGLLSYSNITLCQLLYLVKELHKLNQFPKDAAQQTADEIAKILDSRQDESGKWRNLSETGEITSCILEIELDIDNKGIPFLAIHNINENIVRAIGFLYQAYDKTNHFWYNDINTSAKAIYAIGLYDQAKNYSANDFFDDISLHHQQLNSKNTIESNNSTISTFTRTIYEKEQLIRSLTKSSNRQKLFQRLFFGTFVVSFSLSIMMVLMIAGLSNEVIVVNGESIGVLSRLFNEWQTEFIFGFIGVLFGSLFTSIYSIVKKKTFKD